MKRNAMQTQTGPRNTRQETTGLQVNLAGINTTRVLLMDDDSLFLECLDYALCLESSDFQIVGKTGTGTDAVGMVKEFSPDVVIIGIHTEEAGSNDTIEILCEEHPDIKVIVLGISEDGNNVKRLIKAGISAYLLRNCSLREMAESILSVAGGNCVLTPSIAGKLMAALRGQQNQHTQSRVIFTLSDREKEILQYAATGASNKDIAERCGIRETTVKTHFRNILDKMKARNRAEAVALARSMKLLPKISREEIRFCN